MCSLLVLPTIKGVLIFCPSALFVEIPDLRDYFDDFSGIRSDRNDGKNNQNNSTNL